MQSQTFINMIEEEVEPLIEGIQERERIEPHQIPRPSPRRQPIHQQLEQRRQRLVLEVLHQRLGQRRHPVALAVQLHRGGRRQLPQLLHRLPPEHADARARHRRVPAVAAVDAVPRRRAAQDVGAGAGRGDGRVVEGQAVVPEEIAPGSGELAVVGGGDGRELVEERGVVLAVDGEKKTR